MPAEQTQGRVGGFVDVDLRFIDTFAAQNLEIGIVEQVIDKIDLVEGEHRDAEGGHINLLPELIGGKDGRIMFDGKQGKLS